MLFGILRKAGTFYILDNYYEYMGKPQNIAIYARTSTESQKDGITSQIKSCKSVLKDGELAHIELYKDEAVSGSIDDRKQFQQLLRHISEGQIETVVVSEISRLSRNTLTLMEFLEDVFSDEVGLRVADGSFPTVNPGDPFMKALAQIMAVLAELERELAKMRATRGVEVAIEQGKWVGSPPRGFTTDEDGYLMVVSSEYIQVQAAVEAVLNGSSVYAVSKATGIPNSTLNDIMNNPEKRVLYTDATADDERIDTALNSAEVSEIDSNQQDVADALKGISEAIEEGESVTEILNRVQDSK